MCQFFFGHRLCSDRFGPTLSTAKSDRDLVVPLGGGLRQQGQTTGAYVVFCGGGGAERPKQKAPVVGGPRRM